VDTGFVKKKCDNKGIERGFDSIKTWIALEKTPLEISSGVFI